VVVVVSVVNKVDSLHVIILFVSKDVLRLSELIRGVRVPEKHVVLVGGIEVVLAQNIIYQVGHLFSFRLRDDVFGGL